MSQPTQNPSQQIDLMRIFYNRMRDIGVQNDNAVRGKFLTFLMTCKIKFFIQNGEIIFSGPVMDADTIVEQLEEYLKNSGLDFAAILGIFDNLDIPVMFNGEKLQSVPNETKNDLITIASHKRSVTQSSESHAPKRLQLDSAAPNIKESAVRLNKTLGHGDSKLIIGAVRKMSAADLAAADATSPVLPDVSSFASQPSASAMPQPSANATPHVSNMMIKPTQTAPAVQIPAQQPIATPQPIATSQPIATQQLPTKRKKILLCARGAATDDQMLLPIQQIIKRLGDSFEFKLHATENEITTAKDYFNIIQLIYSDCPTFQKDLEYAKVGILDNDEEVPDFMKKANCCLYLRFDYSGREFVKEAGNVFEMFGKLLSLPTSMSSTYRERSLSKGSAAAT